MWDWFNQHLLSIAFVVGGLVFAFLTRRKEPLRVNLVLQQGTSTESLARSLPRNTAFSDFSQFVHRELASNNLESSRYSLSWRDPANSGSESKLRLKEEQDWKELVDRAISSNETVTVCVKYPPHPATAPVCNPDVSSKDRGNLDVIRDIQQRWIDERDWNQYQTPRNVLLALVGEMGELAECIQWKSDQQLGVITGEHNVGLPGLSEDEKAAFEEELSDVFLYTIRLAAVTRINLAEAWYKKHLKNTKKYPASTVKGSSAKYSTYT